MTKANRYVLWIVAWAVALHAAWGGLLMFSNSPLNTTPLHTYTVLFGGSHRAIGLILLMVAAMAFVGLKKSGNPNNEGILWLMPQQIALLISATGALAAALVGHYADGVPRPHLFILADQLPSILGAIAHSAALFNMYLVRDDEAA